MSTSALPTLTAVTLMQCVVILLDLTHAHVQQDSQGMDSHALVSPTTAMQECFVLFSLFTVKVWVWQEFKLILVLTVCSKQIEKRSQAASLYHRICGTMVIVQTCDHFFRPNYIHEKSYSILIGWERSAVLLLHECRLKMVSDWLKKKKKPPRTNQIRAVLTTKFKKMAMVFSKRRFDFVRETKIEKLKKCSKNPNTVKSTSFWLNVLKMRC